MISSIKNEYAKYVVYLYKHGKIDQLELIFASESINQALIRYKYFDKISESRANDISKLTRSQERLKVLKSNLIQEKNQKRLMTEQKQKEEVQLQIKLHLLCQ